jgi:hypothetical protein
MDRYGSPRAMIPETPIPNGRRLSSAPMPALAEFSGTLYVAHRGFNDNSIYYQTFASLSDLPQSADLISLLPITNTIVGHAFTGILAVGGQLDPVNVIIDTGSSTLAVLASKYDAAPT